jgi:formimidoylglutamate deiminase
METAMDKLHLDKALTPEGWRDDVTLSIGSRRTHRRGHIWRRSVRCDAHRAASGCPALPNLHSHAFQRGMAGLAEVAGESEDSFWTWRDWMYRFALALEPEDVEAIAALAYVEMLEAGFTTAGEFHYLHHGRDGRPYTDPAELARRCIAAAEATGSASPCSRSSTPIPASAGCPPGEGQRRFICDLDLFGRVAEGARAAAAPMAAAASASRRIRSGR